MQRKERIRCVGMGSLNYTAPNHLKLNTHTSFEAALLFVFLPFPFLFSFPPLPLPLPLSPRFTFAFSYHLPHFHASLAFPLLLFCHPTHQVTLATGLCLAQTWISHSIRITSTECSFQTKKTPNLISRRKHKRYLRVLAMPR